MSGSVIKYWAKAKLTGNEEFIEDTTIIELVKEITTFIDQHTHTFYPISDEGRRGGDRDLDQPRTRHAAIRQRIARDVINLVVMDSETKYMNLLLEILLLS